MKKGEQWGQERPQKVDERPFRGRYDGCPQTFLIRECTSSRLVSLLVIAQYMKKQQSICLLLQVTLFSQ